MFSQEMLNGYFGCENVYKNYGKKRVLCDLSFKAKPNAIIGVFGLNGAGKTTLLNILSGLDGNFKGNIYKKDFNDVAFMSLSNYYSPDMRIIDLIDFYSNFLPKFNKQKILNQLLEVHISKRALISTLSSGQKQFVKFILTIYSGASVCLFDEPLSNLDANFREKLIQLLILEINENKLFIISTHEIKEFEKLIDGFYILHDGKFSPYFESEKVIEESGLSINEFYKKEVNQPSWIKNDTINSTDKKESKGE